MTVSTGTKSLHNGSAPRNGRACFEEPAFQDPTFEDYFSALDARGLNPKWGRERDQITAGCPRHDSKSGTAFKVFRKEGHVTHHCFGGCDWAATKKALGLWREWSAPAPPVPRVKPETVPEAKPARGAEVVRPEGKEPQWVEWSKTEYPYRTMDGKEVVFVVVREDKIGANGERVKNIYVKEAGTQPPEGRPLYRLDEVHGADRDKTVYVVEGEKACDALRAHSNLVTTASGGSDSVGRTDWTPLHGRDVVLLADADTPGRKAMRTVGGLLVGKARSIRIHLPTGETGHDVADAIAEGILDAYLALPTEWSPTEARDEADTKVVVPARAEAPATKGVRLVGDLKVIPTTISGFRAALADCQYEFKYSTLRHRMSVKRPSVSTFTRMDTRADQDKLLASGYVREHYYVRDGRSTKTAKYRQAGFRGQILKEAWAVIKDSSRHHELLDYIERLRANPPTEAPQGVNWLSWFKPVIPEDVRWLRCMFGGRSLLFSEYASLLPFMQVIARARKPGTRIRNFLVLAGPEEIGKSHVTHAMLPPELEFGHVEVNPSQFDNKKAGEDLRGKIFAEWPEIVGYRTKDIERCKAFLTRVGDCSRSAFDRDSEDHLRTCTFFLTTNTVDRPLPNDPDGNTRFIPMILTEGVDVKAHCDTNRDAIWYAADQALRAGAPVILPQHWRGTLSRYREEHRGSNPTIIEALEMLESGLVCRYTRKDDTLEDKPYRSAEINMAEASRRDGNGVATNELVQYINAFAAERVMYAQKLSRELGARKMNGKPVWEKDQTRINGKNARRWFLTCDGYCAIAGADPRLHRRSPTPF